MFAVRITPAIKHRTLDLKLTTQRRHTLPVQYPARYCNPIFHPENSGTCHPNLRSMQLSLFSSVSSLGSAPVCPAFVCPAFVGGIAFFPASLQDVDAVAAEVARDIRNQYILAYYSARASTAGYHSVKVQARASGRGKLTVHTRTGYYF